jgi:predicted acylesterase/phospholipase RssA
MKKKYTALVLQGGGALGAYEFGVIKALYEQKNFAPDIICGVSIGAFSAAVIAGAKDGPIEGLEKLWKILTNPENPFVSDYTQLLMSLTYNQGMYFPNPKNIFSPLNNTNFYDTSPLFNTLNEIIDFDKLNSETAPHLIMSATNIATGELDIFTNHHKNKKIRVENIVASGSIPPSFPIINIDDNSYWDGAVFSNTPLKPAIKKLEEMGDENCEREIILVELFPKKGNIPQSISEVYNRSFELTFEAKVSYDISQFEKTDNLIDVFASIDKELAGDSDIRKNPTYRKMMNYKKIHKITTIRRTEEDSDAGAILGTADFREKTIEKRIKQGYQDAQAQLKNAVKEPPEISPLKSKSNKKLASIS